MKNIYFNNRTVINISGVDEDKVLEKLKQRFVWIRAAGGLIFNKRNEILLIKRLGYFDFPKGKCEDNETTKMTAIREVCEECGISEKDLSDIEFFDSSYHIYEQNEQFVIKETSWFKMKFINDYQLTPQIEEDITEILWTINIDRYKKEMYLSLQNLICKLN